MVLAEIAPTEKAEHFIYALLPVSGGIWLSVNFAEDFLSIFAVVSVVSSLLTILLYEIRIDEHVVKRWYARIRDDTSEITKAFLSWNLLLQTWHVVISDPPQFRWIKDDLSDTAKKFTKSVVSSYAIRRTKSLHT